MAYRRVLTIQDISCVGQCSMTVALPILSACGQECCVLPTAVLSTHTGGFGKPAIAHLTEGGEAYIRHWMECGITFDAILIGYLGSLAAIDLAHSAMDSLLAPDGVVIVDPAMADHGKLYSGFDEDYVEKMAVLCRRADILMPNITEICLLLGRAYTPEPDEDYVNDLMCSLDNPRVVLTGVSYAPGTTGIAVKDGSRCSHYSHERVGGSCHGTGDIFAACFTGALMQGKNLPQAVKIAGDFTALAIKKTVEAPAHWYGVKFETALPDLWRMLET